MGLLRPTTYFLSSLFVCFVLLPLVHGIAIRPKAGLTSSGVSGCSGQTAFAALNCPCKLKGQACNLPNLGFRCNSTGICTCGSGFQLINSQCFQLFTIAPTITPQQAPHGVGVPCSVLTNEAVPGLRINFPGGAPPYACSVTPVASAVDDPYGVCGTTPGTTVTNCGTANLIDNCLAVDPTSGEVFVFQGCPIGPITQDLSVICVDSRGIQSNDPPPIFRVNFPLCAPSCA